jgi:hypothetical protein
MPRIGEPSRNGKQSFPEPLSKRNEAVRTEIEKRLDHLTELWNAVEAKVLSMQPPRHISHFFAEHTFENGLSAYDLLGLQRHGGRWRVCYARAYEWNDDEAPDWRPIVDCSTEVRVQAANHIEPFMEEVVKSGKDYIPKVDEAVRSLENALGDI